MIQETNNQITGSTDTQSADRSLLEYLKPKVRHQVPSLLPLANVRKDLFQDSSLPVSLSLPASGNGSVPPCAPLWRVLWHSDNSRTSHS